MAATGDPIGNRARELGARGLLYAHLVDHSPMGALRLSGGYGVARAEGDLAAGRYDLVARRKAGAAANAPDFSNFYTPDPKAYTD